MRIYLAGKMTGIPQFNIPEFDRVAAELRSAGYDVVSPAELDDPETRAAALASVTGNPDDVQRHGTWGDFLSRDVKILADGGIEGVFVMPGWETSRGVRLEIAVARALDVPVMFLPEKVEA